MPDIFESLPVMPGADFSLRPRLVIDLLTGRVADRGRAVPLTPAEAAVVFALAIAERPMRREALVDLLYPEASLPSGSGALRVHVHRVRRRLGPDAIVRDDRGYALHPEIVVEGPRVMREIWSATVPLSDAQREMFSSARNRLRTGRPSCMSDWPWFEACAREMESFERDLKLLLARDAMAHGDAALAVRLAEDALQLDPGDDEAVTLAVRAAILSDAPLHAAHLLHRYAPDEPVGAAG